MKRKKKLHMKKHITNYFIIFLTIFAIITIIFATISEYIYQDTGFAKNLLILGIVCALASFLLLVFFRINNITIVVQVIIVYLFLSFIILIVGYYLYIYDFVYNVKLFISTIISLLIGLIIIILISIIRVKNSNDSLNKNLKNFKERDQ